MSDEMLGRISSDLAVMQRAMGMRVSFGKGMLLFNALLTAIASSAAVASLWIEGDGIQLALVFTPVMLIIVGVFIVARRTHRESTLQVLTSVTVYVVSTVAGCRYTIAAVVGPAMGSTRMILLYSTGLLLLIAFTVLMVRAAVTNREQRYCLGLATAMMVAGLLLPIVDQRYSFLLVHASMAIGFLTALAIQWTQVREAATAHAAD